MALTVPTNVSLEAQAPGMAVLFFLLWVNPPTSPCPTLSAHAEPYQKDIARSDITKLKVSQHPMQSLGTKGLSPYQLKGIAGSDIMKLKVS